MTPGKKWVRFILLSIALSLGVSGVWNMGAQRLSGLTFVDDQMLDRDAVVELGYSGVTAKLIREKDDYYEFGISPVNGFGGEELVAFKDSTGRFHKLWSGQDAPPCWSIPESVPVELVETCLKTISIDRAHPILSSLRWIWSR